MGLVIEKSIEYSTMPRPLRGANWMSVMTAFSGSFGSTSPNATPVRVSYCPTLPNEAPPKAGDVFVLMTICVILASAGLPIPKRAMASEIKNTARATRGRRIGSVIPGMLTAFLSIGLSSSFFNWVRTVWLPSGAYTHWGAGVKDYFSWCILAGECNLILSARALCEHDQRNSNRQQGDRRRRKRQANFLARRLGEN